MNLTWKGKTFAAELSGNLSSILLFSGVLGPQQKANYI